MSDTLKRRIDALEDLMKQYEGGMTRHQWATQVEAWQAEGRDPAWIEEQATRTVLVDVGVSGTGEPPTVARYRHMLALHGALGIHSWGDDEPDYFKPKCATCEAQDPEHLEALRRRARGN
ncbi:MAG: hypothetical protein HY347_06595 [candidate division NC10 bacterium]|nr:hypothetical protein [candidate division NC10 bacterium]